MIAVIASNMIAVIVIGWRVNFEKSFIDLLSVATDSIRNGTVVEVPCIHGNLLKSKFSRLAAN